MLSTRTIAFQLPGRQVTELVQGARWCLNSLRHYQAHARLVDRDDDAVPCVFNCTKGEPDWVSTHHRTGHELGHFLVPSSNN
jgi:hypothetical protein